MLRLSGLCVCLVPDDWSRTPSRWSQPGLFLHIRSWEGCKYRRKCPHCVTLSHLCNVLTSMFRFSLAFFLLPPVSLVRCQSVSGFVCFFSFGVRLHRDLSNNQISELASDAFQGLRSLNSLWVILIMFIIQMEFAQDTSAKAQESYEDVKINLI